MDKIAIKLCCRNEDDFLDEWFQYYISLGFKNFIIYDDESTDNTNNIINFYKNIINIDYFKIKLEEKLHWKHTFDHFKKYDFILFIDIDEFLFLRNNFDLSKFLINSKNNNVSVIQIPRLDVGNKNNYYKENYGFENFKYNFIEGNFNKNQIVTKCFFSPSLSSLTKNFSSHTCIPNETTKIICEKYELSFTGNYYLEKKNIIKSIFDFDMILIHNETQDNNILNKSFKKI